MSFISSTFSNLTLNVSKGMAATGVNAAFHAANYTKREGQLKFISNRGYNSVFVYAAKRTMMQMAFATINDLYPKYVRQLEKKKAEVAYAKYQGSEMQKIITNGQKADEDLNNPHGVTLHYQGKSHNEGLLLWIKGESTAPQDVTFNTYWDKILGLSHDEAKNANTIQGTTVKVPGTNVFLDLGAIVQAKSGNNLVLTKVQGRDYTRKELISGDDVTFTVTGQIASNFPDVYPYSDVSKFVTLMQHKGVIQVYNIMFQQFNVTQILIKDFQLTQNKGFKNIQPYSFTCVAVEPDDAVKVVEDTIGATNLQIAASQKKGWAKVLLDQVKESAANQAAQMIATLTSEVI